VAEGNAGNALFRALADFSALRREAKQAKEELKNLGGESEKTNRKLGDTEQQTTKSGNGFTRLSGRLREVKKDLDKFRSSDAGKSIDNIAKSAEKMLGVLGKVGGKIAGFSLIALASTAAVGPILSLVGAVAQLSGAVGVIPAVLGAGAAAAGTLALGMVGLKDAFKPVASAVGGLASAQKAADRASVQGAEQVRSARQRLADAYVEGARRVEQAERALSRAQRDAKDAQDELTKARKEAQEELEDLNSSLTGAGLDQRQAAIDLQRAKERLAEVQSTPGSSQLDLQEAQLGVDQATQAVAEAAKRYERLKVEAQAANQAGVEGAESVVMAQRRVGDAITEVGDAQDALTQARVDSARQIQDAERDLAMAIQQAAWAQQDAAASLAKAGGDAAPKLAASAQSLVDKIKSLKPAWEDLRLDVQEKLFAGLSDKVGGLANKYLPMLKTNLGGIATASNGMAHDFADWLGQKSTVDDFGSSLHNITGFWENLRGVVKPLSQAFLDIFKVGSEFLPGMGKGLAGVAQKFADFIHEARESGKLKEWIGNGIQALKDLGGVLVNIGRIFGAIFKAGQSEGHGFLQTLRDATGKVADFLNSAEGQDSLRKMFKAIGDAVNVLMPILKTAFKVFADILPILVTIGEKVGPGVQKFIEGIGKAFETARPGLEKLAAAFGKFLEALGNAGPFIGSVVNGISNVLSPVIEAIAFVIKTLTDLFNLLPKPMQDFIGGLGGIAVAAGLAIIAIKKIMDWGGKLLDVFSKVTDGVGKLTDSLGGVDDSSVAGGGAVGGSKDKKNKKTTTTKKTGRGFGLIGGLAGVASGVAAFDMGSEAMDEFKDGATSKSEATRDAIGAGLMGGAGVASMFGPWGLAVGAALAAASLIVSNWDTVKGWFVSFGQWVAGWAGPALGAIVDAWNASWKWVSDRWTEFSNWFGGNWDAFWSVVGANWDRFWGGARDIWNSFTNWVSTTASDFAEAVKGGLNKIGDFLSSTWNSIWKGASDLVTDVTNTITKTVGDMVRNIKDGIKAIDDLQREGKKVDPMLSAASGALKVLGFNKGGKVPGSGNSDSVDIKTTPGEYVMPKKATAKWLPVLRAMNPYDTGGAGLMQSGMSVGDLMRNAVGSASAAAGSSAGRAVVSAVRDLRRPDPAGGPSIGQINVTQVVHNPVPEKPSVTASKKVGRAAALGAKAVLKGVA
jgi:hypothetical protein